MKPKGTDCEYKLKKDQTPLHLAVMNNDPRYYPVLVMDELEAVQGAKDRCPRPEICRLLISNGANLKARDGVRKNDLQ